MNRLTGGGDLEEYRRIRAALVGHSEQVLDVVADQLAYLGSKVEWSMDDNLDATEDLVRLAETIGLHSAGDQDASGVEFYRAAAAHLGLRLESPIRRSHRRHSRTRERAPDRPFADDRSPIQASFCFLT